MLRDVYCHIYTAWSFIFGHLLATYTPLNNILLFYPRQLMYSFLVLLCNRSDAAELRAMVCDYFHLALVFY